MKRFYRAVDVEAMDGGFAVRLDGRRVKTPAKAELVLPSAALARAIAAEWSAQTDAIRPESMPLMRLAATALDRVAADPGAVAAAAGKYAETDLLCYRAERPSGLAERQRDLWQPLLDWASIAFDAPLLVTTGMMPVTQPDATLRALRAVLDAMTALELCAAADLAASTGSLVLALAVWQRRITPGEAIEAALLDEEVQAEQWGRDEEAEARRGQLRNDIEAASSFLLALAG